MYLPSLWNRHFGDPAFRSGLRTTGLAYLSVLGLFILLHIPPLWDGIFLYALFPIGVVLLGTLWWIIDLVLSRKRWCRGSLLMNTLILLPLWYLLLNFPVLGDAQ